MSPPQKRGSAPTQRGSIGLAGTHGAWPGPTCDLRILGLCSAHVSPGPCLSYFLNGGVMTQNFTINEYNSAIFSFDG